MPQIPLEEARTHLDELIQAAVNGDEVVITKDSKPVVRVVAIAATKPRPSFGSARGKIHMAEDFDAPLEDFKPYAP